MRGEVLWRTRHMVVCHPRWHIAGPAGCVVRHADGVILFIKAIMRRVALGGCRWLVEWRTGRPSRARRRPWAVAAEAAGPTSPAGEIRSGRLAAAKGPHRHRRAG